MGRSAVPNVAAPVAVTSVGAFGYVAFAWSSAHIDTAMTSSLYQMWPVVWFLAVRGVDTRRAGSHHRTGVPSRVYVLSPVAVAGTVLVVVAAGDSSTRAGGSTAAGMTLALVSAVLVSATAAHFLAVDRIVFDAGDSRDSPAPAAEFGDIAALHLQESVSLSVQAFSRLCVLPVLGMLVISESSWGGFVSWQMWGGFVAGTALQAPGGYLLRRAVFTFPRREIVALHYLEPGVAVLWLWLWRGIDVARPGMWLAGLAAVVVANIVICAPDTP